jgi:hypothetical protein
MSSEFRGKDGLQLDSTDQLNGAAEFYQASRGIFVVSVLSKACSTFFSIGVLLANSFLTYFLNKEFCMRSKLRTWSILGAAAYGAVHLARPWFNHWGATKRESTMPVPGVEHLKNPKITATHAITIAAPRDEIWPWLIQMGVDRGGFYSYSWLENLVGCGVRNIHEIRPELQNLKQGDTITLHPKAPALRVTRLEAPRVLALEGWIFYLLPMGLARTRLIVRGYAVKAARTASFMERLRSRLLQSVWFDLAHFIMQRKQLREIKRLAEEQYERSRSLLLADHA